MQLPDGQFVGVGDGEKAGASKGYRENLAGLDGRLDYMNLCKCFVVVLLGLVGAVAAHAQLGVYGSYAGEKLSGIECFSASSTLCSNNAQPAATGSVNPSGFWGGAYYDFRNVGPIRLGLDVRGGEGHANRSASTSVGDKNATEEYSAMGGVRGSIKTKYSWLTPYAQIDAGWTRSNATEAIHINFDNFVRYEAFAGADLRLSSFLDLRAVELGIGNMNRFGSGTGTSSVGVKSIGAGVVLHLPSK
jgi:hypothetical protein